MECLPLIILSTENGNKTTTWTRSSVARRTQPSRNPKLISANSRSLLFGIRKSECPRRQQTANAMAMGGNVLYPISSSSKVNCDSSSTDAAGVSAPSRAHASVCALMITHSWGAGRKRHRLKFVCDATPFFGGEMQRFYNCLCQYCIISLD